MIGKVLSEAKPIPPPWAKKFEILKTGENGNVLTIVGEKPEWVRQYPLTEDECVKNTDGTLQVKEDSYLHKWLSEHPRNASNSSQPIFFKLK